MNELSDAQSYMFILTLLLGVFSIGYIDTIMRGWYKPRHVERQIVEMHNADTPVIMKIRTEGYHLQTMRARHVLDQRLLDRDFYIESVKRDLVRYLADTLLPYVKITLDERERPYETIMEAELKIAIKD